MSGPLFIPTPPPLPTYTPEQAREKLCPLISSRNKDGTINRAPCEASQCALWEWWLPPVGNFVGIGFCSIPKVVAKSKAGA